MPRQMDAHLKTKAVIRQTNMEYRTKKNDVSCGYSLHDMRLKSDLRDEEPRPTYPKYEHAVYFQLRIIRHIAYCLEQLSI
jgi:hypothetical protein